MLANKVAQLKRETVVADRIVSFWEKQIDFYGEAKAEAFYKSIGLNHLETKAAVEWEGMMLSREPTEAEKVCVKGVSQAQESGKVSVTSVLMKARESMIDSAMTEIEKLKPATYHELIIEMPAKAHSELRNQVDSIFMHGKKLVAAELGKKASKQSQPDDGEDSELDDLTDLTDARLANDIQARVTAAATRFALLGLTGNELWKAVRKEVEAGSVSYIDRSSTGLTNKVLNMGRSSEADDRSDEWDRVEYSALLDQNVCDPCAADDGETAADESELTPAPNPDCAGGDWCRCFHVFINQ